MDEMMKAVANVLGRDVSEHWEALRDNWWAFCEHPERYEYVKDCVLKWLDDEFPNFEEFPSDLDECVDPAPFYVFIVDGRESWSTCNELGVFGSLGKIELPAEGEHVHVEDGDLYCIAGDEFCDAVDLRLRERGEDVFTLEDWRRVR